MAPNHVSLDRFQDAIQVCTVELSCLGQGVDFIQRSRKLVVPGMVPQQQTGLRCHRCAMPANLPSLLFAILIMLASCVPLTIIRRNAGCEMCSSLYLGAWTVCAPLKVSAAKHEREGEFLSLTIAENATEKEVRGKKDRDPSHVRLPSTNEPEQIPDVISYEDVCGLLKKEPANFHALNVVFTKKFR